MDAFRKIGIALAVAVLAALAGPVESADAAAFVVTKAADTNDGVCNSDCSFREAWQASTAAVQFSTITFASDYTIVLGSVLPNRHEFSPVHVDATGKNIVLDGSTSAQLGATLGTSAMTFTHVTFRNFTVGSANIGDMTLRNCTIRGNATDFPFLTNVGGLLRIYGCTFRDNSVSSGSVLTNSTGTTSISNSTFSNNSGLFAGAVVGNGGTLRLTNNTFAGNSGPQVFNGTGTMDFSNNIVADTVGGPDCKNWAVIGSNNNNLVEDGSCEAPLSGDPGLLPLADNGGPTETHSIRAHSLAYNAGNDAICSADPVLGVDQRGMSRPFGSHCDIGAVESRDQCGNGTVQPGEQCDDGNGLTDDCCSPACQFDAVAVPCGDHSDAICDNPDSCDGAGLCRSNHRPNSTECRTAVGTCDVAELCNSGSCPADAFASPSTPCGDASGSICDHPDSCDGAGACRPNIEPNTTECRTAVDACDVAESCASGSCPSDGLASHGTPCGNPGDTACDGADSCDGFGACLSNLEPAATGCPDDGNDCTDDYCDGAGDCAHPGITAPCDDGIACTTEDTCVGGVCLGAVPPECDDGNPCTQDSCDDTLGCQSAGEPRSPELCIDAPKASLQIKQDPDTSRNQLKWKWGSGGAFDQAALGDPVTDTTYSFCLYDMAASVPSLSARIDIVPSALWSSEDPKGFGYSDKAGSSDGARKLAFKTGAEGRTKASLTAGGVNLPVITPPDETVMFAQEPKVIMQLVSSDGLCLTSGFDAASTRANDVAQFKAKTK